jgi:hypothetical protein
MTIHRFDQQRTAAALGKLFITYPSQSRGDDEAIAADRIARVGVYLDALVSYEAQDVEGAVQAFLSGCAPGHNPAFAPSAPQVGAEARRQMNLRLDSEHREEMRRPQLPPPDAPKSNAVAEGMKQLADKLGEQMRTDDARVEAKRKGDWAKVHARFAPQSDAERAELLGYGTAFEVGDSDSDAA